MLKVDLENKNDDFSLIKIHHFLIQIKRNFLFIENEIHLKFDINNFKIIISQFGNGCWVINVDL